MATPQLENGYTMIANELVEAFARVNMSGREWQVLFAILRKTYGFHKKMDKISLSQISKMTGIASSDVARIIKKLEGRKMIEVRRGEWSNSYWLNKQWLKWLKGSGCLATYKRYITKYKYNMATDVAPTPMNPQELNDGEVTYEEENTPKSKKYGNKRKLYSRLVAYYMKLLGKTGNALRFFPTMKEIYDLYIANFPTDSEDEIEKEIKGRIDVAHWHYSKLGFKEWGLGKIAENWKIILDWSKEKKKHN